MTLSNTIVKKIYKNLENTTYVAKGFLVVFLIL